MHPRKHPSFTSPESKIPGGVDTGGDTGVDSNQVEVATELCLNPLLAVSPHRLAERAFSLDNMMLADGLEQLCELG